MPSTDKESADRDEYMYQSRNQCRRAHRWALALSLLLLGAAATFATSGVPAAGTYLGLLSPEAGTALASTNSGLVSVKVASNGVATVTLTLNQQILRGSTVPFDASGAARLTLTNGPGRLSQVFLQTQAENPDALAVTVDANSTRSETVAVRAPAKATPAIYSAQLAHAQLDQWRNDYGVATINLGPNGVTTVRLSQPNGKSFTILTSWRADGTLPLYGANATGCLVGQLQVQENQEVRGSLRWQTLPTSPGPGSEEAFTVRGYLVKPPPPTLLADAHITWPGEYSDYVLPTVIQGNRVSGSNGEMRLSGTYNRLTGQASGTLTRAGRTTTWLAAYVTPTTLAGYCRAEGTTARLLILSKPLPSPVEFSPNGGSFTGPQSVRITSMLAETLHYRIGTGPWQSVPRDTTFVFLNGLNNGSGTLQAYGTISGANTSAVATSAAFQFTTATPQVSTRFTNDTFTATLQCATPMGVTFHYTTNGTIPTRSSPTAFTVVQSPVRCRESTTRYLRAIATTPRYADSAVATVSYTQLGTGTVSPAGGSFYHRVAVKITPSRGASAICSTNGAPFAVVAPGTSQVFTFTNTTTLSLYCAGSNALPSPPLTYRFVVRN